MTEPSPVPVNLTTAQRIGHRVALEDLSDPRVCGAHAVWRQRKGQRLFPARSELVPKQIAPYLRNVMLIAMNRDQSDFEFRVVGDAAVVAYGRNFQGMTRDELNVLEPGFGDVIKKVCAWVCRRREPLAVKGIVASGVASAYHHEGIFLPLGECELSVDHVLFVGSYIPMDASDLVEL